MSTIVSFFAFILYFLGFIAATSALQAIGIAIAIDFVLLLLGA